EIESKIAHSWNERVTQNVERYRGQQQDRHDGPGRARADNTQNPAHHARAGGIALLQHPSAHACPSAGIWNWRFALVCFGLPDFEATPSAFRSRSTVDPWLDVAEVIRWSTRLGMPSTFSQRTKRNPLPACLC